MTWILICWCLTLPSLLPVFGQSAQSLPSFEVASVKRVPPGHDTKSVPAGLAEMVGFQGGPGTGDPTRIDYTEVTLKALLSRAYDLPPEQISGPPWLDTERYDIAAKVPAGTDNGQLRSMLQGLLVERFQIRFHRESKVVPVYFLTVGKNGPKLHSAEPLPEGKLDDEAWAAMRKRASSRLAADAAAHARGQYTPSRWFHLPRTTMTKFAQTLSSNLDRPVRDRTHLDGLYSLTLGWEPDGKPAVDGQVGPSIFVAIQEQLGLRLQSGNDLVELLIIDTAQELPIKD